MSPILEYVYQVTGVDTAYILAGMLACDSDFVDFNNCDIM